MMADLVSDESLLFGLQMIVVFLYPHMEESRDRKQALLSVLMRALIPFLRAPSLLPNYFLKVLPPALITWKIRISIQEFWEDTDIPSITPWSMRCTQCRARKGQSCALGARMQWTRSGFCSLRRMLLSFLEEDLFLDLKADSASLLQFLICKHWEWILGWWRELTGRRNERSYCSFWNNTENW